MRAASSEYLAWVKSRPPVRFHLGRSGMPPRSLMSLGLDAEGAFDLEPNDDGWPPLVEALAARYDVATERVVVSQGTSMANHLVYAALLEPGDHTIIEEPSYEPLRALAEYCGATISHLPRRIEDAHAINVDELSSLITPHTKLVVLSDLHNPTGATIDSPTLRALAAVAEKHGVHILFDEVYLEFIYPQGRRTAATTSPWFVATRSLTKAYGLDSLRMGWIIAAPELASRIRRMNDLFGVNAAHPIERAAVYALRHADGMLAEANELLARNIDIADRFVRDHEGILRWARPPGGTVGWIQTTLTDVDRTLQSLEAEAGTRIVPGRFFGSPTCLRLGWSFDRETLEEGLRRFSQQLRSGTP